MLLISLGQFLPWIFGGLFILTIILSSKGVLSPIFTIILLLIFGGSSFFSIPNHLSVKEDNLTIELDKDTQPETTKKDPPLPKSKKEIDPKTSIPKDKTSKIKKIPFDNKQIPKEYEVTDNRLWTYKISGYWKWDKFFVDYFAEKTGWKKIKKGNYEITIKPIGNFTQKVNDDERLYVHPGGEIEIRVNGKLCCCENIVSIPEGISHSQLVKAKEILQNTISNLLLENKEKVVTQLQKCF